MEDEFTYTFGGCTIQRGLEGSYLSQSGEKVPDRINMIYTDIPLTLESQLKLISRYTDALRRVTHQALNEEAILVVIFDVYHQE